MAQLLFCVLACPHTIKWSKDSARCGQAVMLLIFDVKISVISISMEAEKEGDFNLLFPCVSKERLFDYFLVVFDLKLVAVNFCFSCNCAKVINAA